MQTSFKQLYSRYRQYFMNILVLYGKRSDFKRFLELILNLVAVSIFSIFAIKPTAATIIALTKEIKAKEDTIAVMDEKIVNLKNAQNIYYQNKSAIDILNQAIPTLPSPDLTARQIEGIAKLNSLMPSSITFSSSVLKGTDDTKRGRDEFASLPAKTKAITISMSGKSSYESIVSFVVNLEFMRRPFKIDVLNISKKNISKDEEQGELTFSINGRVPYYSNTVIPTPIPEEVPKEE